uniref:Uncharacterized protein n=1 Tax=Chromera velia CCMP2878 TaxID=1169474 RepID=A0A0G4GNU7_9ALVE|eukprot:Cvel_22728.t1-p1 / transcript=Cvel_22728.t1 / gene=Cvel_22728 / organism=Chromera_velia_CCMP2878 / gene_product=hypothetical protein / transcript_product=hypothetical protein / location=Cvel_scaffold2265:14532-17946(+) / protein_length=527 / sequence_SO=supercontig / SO=protein_coding / is_pseudo=false
MGLIQIRQLSNLVQILDNSASNPLYVNVTAAFLASTSTLNYFMEFSAELQLGEKGPRITDGRSLFLAACLHLSVLKKTDKRNSSFEKVVKCWMLSFNRRITEPLEVNAIYLVCKDLQTRQLDRRMVFLYDLTDSFMTAISTHLNSNRGPKRALLKPTDIKETQIVNYVKETLKLQLRPSQLSLGMAAWQLGRHTCDLINAEDKAIVAERIGRRGEKMSTINGKRLAGPTFIKLGLLKKGVDPWTTQRMTHPTPVLCCFSEEELELVMKEVSTVLQANELQQVIHKRSMEDIAGGQLARLRVAQVMMRLLSADQAATQAAKKFFDRLHSAVDLEMADLCLKARDIEMEENKDSDDLTAARILQLEQEREKDLEAEREKKAQDKQREQEILELKKQQLNEKHAAWLVKREQIMKANKLLTDDYITTVTASREEYNDKLLKNHVFVRFSVDELRAIEEVCAEISKLKTHCETFVFWRLAPERFGHFPVGPVASQLQKVYPSDQGYKIRRVFISNRASDNATRGETSWRSA